MREVEYRGRRVSDGEWVYGLPHVIDVVGEGYTGLAIQTQFESNRPVSYQIDKGTLSQYTGLHDQNGKKIFEGDILGAEEDNPLYVEYSTKYGSFVFVDKFNRYGIEQYTAKEISYEAFEIIGNIHEHSYLLEVVR